MLNSVLLIEDDMGDAILVQELMEQQSCVAKFSIAQRLSEALQKIESDSYDIILTDMNLPDSAGLNTLKRVIDMAPSVPIIVLTGLNDEEFGIEAVKSGAQDYLVKGDIDGRVLKRAIYYACERKKLEMDLKRTKDLYEQQSRIDFLTGIYNRLMLNELLNAEIQRRSRMNTPLTVVMFDIDKFKHINDTYGHIIGDHVLKEMATLFGTNIRADDIFARWGGEEFLILTPGCTTEQASALAEKLRQSMQEFDFGDGLRATASFGVTEFRDDDTFDTFIVRADEAMYTAKNKGRNRVEML